MGAIAALLSRTGPPDEAAVRRMLDAAPHRGSCGAVRSIGRFAVGVANPGEADAWQEATVHGLGGWVLAFNGVLDNIDEVSDLASAGGYEPAMREPGAVVLAAFRALGAELPARLRGLFAVVVSDGLRLWAFRDHLGYRPLFVRRDGTGTFLASEAKQVVAGAGITREPDPDVLEAIFYSTYDNDTPCAVRGVRRLAKATLLAVDDTSLRLSQYWRPEDWVETARPSTNDIAEAFDTLMGQAVERALSGRDVLSLSGGIDSTTIGAFAAPAYLRRFGHPLPALASLYPEQPSVDEREYIMAMSDAFGMRLVTYDRAADGADVLERWGVLADSPIPGLTMGDIEEHYQHAAAHGFRTMLTGEMAEFLVDQRRYLLPHLLRHGRLRAAWAHALAQREQGDRLASLAFETVSTVVPRSVEAFYRRHGGASDQYPVWLDRRRFSELVGEQALPSRDRWRAEQTALWTGPGYSGEAEEICQALYRVRVRRPWADIDLWQFFLSLPAEMKLLPGLRKRLIREFMRGRVPDVILDRTKKTVFNASLLARADYSMLRKYIGASDYRLPGVNYRILLDDLEGEHMDLRSYLWAQDIAAIHAFLVQFA